eukprot:TRINITY_DN8799_c0_g2_i1.p1 TRINITY_DN8799_c0_g2~~TRINITY_DN8799_c0_g2_i1.p1  ORF type:complete len:479 (+),score=213.63 TRINITY_DN8799_c0_g2_i1:87-1439(+)
MKLKVLSRSPREHRKERASDTAKIHRNLDPKLHPFERQLEYTRAVQASKLDRMFAKPFVAALDGHLDGIQCLAKDPTSLSLCLSGAHDGEIRLWNIQKRQLCHSVPRAHRAVVNGLCVCPDGAAYLSCSADKAVRLWDMDGEHQLNAEGNPRPLAEFLGEHSFTSVDHHTSRGAFVSAGHNLETWDLTRQRPVSKFNWGIDSVTVCRYNQSEPELVLCCMSDRAICIYDSRVEQATQKMVLSMRSNAVCWNPMEPMVFAAACEDHNVYQFDARMLRKAQLVFVSHVAAVLDVDYAPTGRELVSASFDRTIRLWRTDFSEGQSRDVYHTKRMRRVWAVKWSLDNKFVISGSDDMNVRLWKSNAAAPLKHLHLKERRKIEYYDKLRDRFKHFSEVKRISKQRLIPKHVKVAQRKKGVMAKSRKRKFSNRAQNTRKQLQRPQLKKDSIVGVVD